MTDIALLMTGVLTTRQPFVPILPEQLLVQPENGLDESTRVKSSQTVPNAQIIPPEFMQSYGICQATPSALTIENENILNQTEKKKPSKSFSCLDKSKDTKKALGSIASIRKLEVARRNSTVRSFPRNQAESKKVLLASRPVLEFLVTSEDARGVNSRRRKGRPTDKPVYQTVAATSRIYESQLPTLRFGNSGLSVRVLQRLLSSNGYGIGVDGVYGALTEVAVKAFQDQRNLEVDGVVGEKTWYELARKL